MRNKCCSNSPTDYYRGASPLPHTYRAYLMFGQAIKKPLSAVISLSPLDLLEHCKDTKNIINANLFFRL